MGVRGGPECLLQSQTARAATSGAGSAHQATSFTVRGTTPQREASVKTQRLSLLRIILIVSTYCLYCIYTVFSSSLVSLPIIEENEGEGGRTLGGFWHSFSL